MRNKLKYVTTQALLVSNSANPFIAYNLISPLKINCYCQAIQSAPEKRKAHFVINVEIGDLYKSDCLSLNLFLSVPSIPASPNDGPTQEGVKKYDNFRNTSIESVTPM